MWEQVIGVILGVVSFLAVVYLGNKILKQEHCKHKWAQIKTTDHYITGFGERSYMYTTVRCQCQHCGELKTFKLKG